MAVKACGFSLRNNVIVLASIQLIGEIIGVTLKSLLIAGVIRDVKHSDVNLGMDIDGEAAAALNPEAVAENSAANVSIASFSLIIAAHVVQMILAVILLIGAMQDSTSKCRIWVHVTAGLLLVILIIMIINALLGHDSATSIAAVLPFVFFFLYKLYAMWIIYAFIRSLQYERVAAMTEQTNTDHRIHTDF